MVFVRFEKHRRLDIGSSKFAVDRTIVDIVSHEPVDLDRTDVAAAAVDSCQPFRNSLPFPPFLAGCSK